MAEVHATRACVVCGNALTGHRARQVCSTACDAIRQRGFQAASNARKVKPTRQCQWCKAEFTPAHGTGYAYCGGAHAKAAKDARDAARRLTPECREKQRQHSAEWVERNRDRARKAQAQSAAKRRAERGRGDRSKEYAAHRRRARKANPVPVSRVMIPITRMVRAARGAEQSIRNMIGRCDSPTYGMTDAQSWKYQYNNDPLFRQAEIQRLKASKLKRLAGKRHCKMSAKQVRAVYAERSSCLYCGCSLAIGEKVLDHMDPLSKGGAHDASNLVVACKKCNTRKAAKEFVKWLPLVAEGRRKLVADWYARKHGAQPEQRGLSLMMAA